jgi:tetratricopeptide (TPR) repeat protein
MAAPVKRYKAFISYSWADKAWGEWAHRALETYQTPKALVGKPAALGPVPARLTPIFKDREEEAAGAGITASIEAAMTASDFMIVICSPTSARSKWVNHEVAWFKTHRDKRRILALVVDGEPGASFMPGREAEECFPRTLLYEVGADLQPTEEREDVPLAADARKAGDGKRGAKLKLAAALLGLGLDDLVRREDRRRAIRRRVVTTALTVLSLWMTANTWFAISQRNEARAQRALAERQTENVNAALDYLVSIFEIANPATDNPKTITALTILERGRAKIDAELGDKPVVRARLLTAIGSVYQNLGEIRDAAPILGDAARGPFATLGDEVDARMHYADALVRLRIFDKAQAEIDAAATAIDAAKPAPEPAMLNLYRMEVERIRATMAYFKGDYDQAVLNYRSAIKLCEETSACDADARASLSNNLSIAFNESGRVAEARAEMLIARKIIADKYGEDHLETAIADQNLAYTDFRASNFQPALAAMPRVIAVYERVLEETHPLRATANLLLGRLYLATGETEAAAAALAKARDAYEIAYGPDHDEVAWASMYRALAVAKTGRREEAFQDLARAEAIYRKKYPPDDPNFGDILAHQGFVLADLGDAPTAAAACKRGVEQMAKMLPADDSWLQSTRQQCAPIISATGR